MRVAKPSSVISFWKRWNTVKLSKAPLSITVARAETPATRAEGVGRIERMPAIVFVLVGLIAALVGVIAVLSAMLFSRPPA